METEKLIEEKTKTKIEELTEEVHQLKVINENQNRLLKAQEEMINMYSAEIERLNAIIQKTN